MNFNLINQTAAGKPYSYSFDAKSEATGSGLPTDGFSPSAEGESGPDLAALARSLNARRGGPVSTERVEALKSRMSSPSILSGVAGGAKQMLAAAGVKGIVPGYGDGNW